MTGRPRAVGEAAINEPPVGRQEESGANSYFMKKQAFLFMLLCLACALSGCMPASEPAPLGTAIPTLAPTAAPEPAPEPVPEPTPEPDYRYISAADAYALLQAGQALALDIQPQKYYDEDGHIDGAVATFAYPANTLGLQKRLRTALNEVRSAQAVILVDMAGKGGARNASDFYAASGVEKARLFILEGGMLAWPYADMRIVEIGEYEPQTMRPSALRGYLRDEKPLCILDIRDAAAFAAGHFPNAVNLPASLTAFSEAEAAAALSHGFALIEAAPSDGVLIVSEEGGADAEFAAAYYASHGVDTQRLFILRDGAAGWPESRAEYLISDLPAPGGASGSDGAPAR